MAIVLTPITHFFDKNNKLLIHSNEIDGNTSIIDDSDYRHTITVNGNTHHEADQSKFNISSIYFDGTGDYLSIPNHRGLKLKSNNFNIDFWIRADNITSSGILLIKSPGEHEIQISQSNANITLDASSNGTSWDIASSRTICTISATTWTHIALNRQENTWKTYKNGTLSDTLTSSSSIYDEEGSLYIGGDGTTNYQGYIDEIRILNGISEWTEDFTPFKYPYKEEKHKSINIIDLYPYGSFAANKVKGTVKNSSGTPLERDISSYFIKPDEDTGTKIHELHKVTTSDSNGDFILTTNQKNNPITIVIHGETDENDVIYKDIIVL